MYFMFLEESPFLALFWLASLSVVTTLNGISHGRHDGGCSDVSRCRNCLL
jgi:hypothetical protein